MASEIRISVAGDIEAAAQLESLWDWLRSDPGLHGMVHQARTTSGYGAMGVPIELLIALSSSSGATAIALSRVLKTWLEQRRSDVSLTVTKADGSSVTVSAKRISEADELLRGVLHESHDEAS